MKISNGVAPLRLATPIVAMLAGGDTAIRVIFSDGNVLTTQLYIDEMPAATCRLNGVWKKRERAAVDCLDQHRLWTRYEPALARHARVSAPR